jgi:flagellar L-ring protein precursor FlgH
MKYWLFSLVLYSAAFAKKPQTPQTSPLEDYIQAASQHSSAAEIPSSGSLWLPDARLGDLGADLRARRVDDVVTIVVEERASAVSRGSVSASRNSSASAKVDAALGPRKSGWLPNLATVSGQRKLDGQGETVRETVLNTVLTARVVQVLPNGNLVVEAAKAVTVNSETQRVLVRGVVRPFDLTTANAVRSDQIAMLEVSVAGKGVIGDAVRQPNALYRLLLGLLPF